MDSLSGNTHIRDNYASLCTFYRNLPSWKLKKEVCHVYRHEVYYANCILHKARTENPHQFTIFRLAALPNYIDGAIIFDFRLLLPCNDLTLDSLFVPIASPSPSILEEQRIALFTYDVP